MNHATLLSAGCFDIQRPVAFTMPTARMRSEGSRSSLGVWGQGVCSLGLFGYRSREGPMEIGAGERSRGVSRRRVG